MFPDQASLAFFLPMFEHLCWQVGQGLPQPRRRPGPVTGTVSGALASSGLLHGTQTPLRVGSPTAELHSVPEDADFSYAVYERDGDPILLKGTVSILCMKAAQGTETELSKSPGPALSLACCYFEDSIMLPCGGLWCLMQNENIGGDVLQFLKCQ